MEGVSDATMEVLTYLTLKEGTHMYFNLLLLYKRSINRARLRQRSTLLP